MNHNLFTLETERLLLRPIEIADAPAMFAMDKNPKVHQYLWNQPVQHINEIHQVIGYIHEQYQRNKIGRFATILKETGEFIGWTGIKFVDDHTENGNTNFFDYGYRLAEEYWGKGYASEATKAWLDYGFGALGVETFHAYTHFNNQASNHILNKTGFLFIETYADADGAQWNWWKAEKSDQASSKIQNRL